MTHFGTKDKKDTKILLLIVSILLLTGCKNTLKDNLRIDDYEFYSLTEFNREIEIPADVDVIANMKDSKKIKGPIKSGIVKNMRLVNKTKNGDTLEATFYGNDFRFFSIGEDIYEAENPIISK
jgi:hypothetical protein